MMQTNPVKVIRAKCLDCCCGNSNEVAECRCVPCPLHPFRFGKNPYRTKRELTDEQRKEIAERLARSKKTIVAECENGKETEE